MQISQNSGSYSKSNQIYFKSHIGNVYKKVVIPHIENVYKYSAPDVLPERLDNICSMTKQFYKFAKEDKLDSDDVKVFISLRDVISNFKDKINAFAPITKEEREGLEIFLKSCAEDSACNDKYLKIKKAVQERLEYSVDKETKLKINGKMNETIRSVSDTFDVLRDKYDNFINCMAREDACFSNRLESFDDLAAKDKFGTIFEEIGDNLEPDNPFNETFELIKKHMVEDNINNLKVKSKKYTKCGNNYAAAYKVIFYPHMQQASFYAKNCKMGNDYRYNLKLTEKLEDVHNIITIMTDRMFSGSLNKDQFEMLQLITKQSVNTTGHIVKNSCLDPEIRLKNAEILENIDKIYKTNIYLDKSQCIDPKMDKVIQEEMAFYRENKEAERHLSTLDKRSRRFFFNNC